MPFSNIPLLDAVQTEQSADVLSKFQMAEVTISQQKLLPLL